ncbi:DNA (cytosine-5-)-methyltransferase, partial [Vibrio sp. Vb2201]|uniref:DNA cytosine methyltransferase n=1 Tax=Vibrio sp. Vb2201 TaxID=3074655 RepID=UPI00296498EB
MNVVTLFSGCGGLDLSFHQLGFNILWANDFDPKACETYALNIGNHVVCEDITKVDVSTIPGADLILGGFPCQDFSMIWKREGIETERGNLYKNFVNIVSDKNPKMFVAENVKGLLTANKGQAIKTIIDDFSHTGEFGYNVTPHLVNFADYGAPQLRERVLLIGVRKDLKKDFIMPDKTHSPENYLSSGEALKGVEKVPFNNE